MANVSGVSTIDRSEIEISVRKHNICEFYMGALKGCEKVRNIIICSKSKKLFTKISYVLLLSFEVCND